LLVVTDDELLFDAYLRKKPPFKLEDFLFGKQLEFVQDPNPFKTAVCSRRAGKTVACAGDLVDSALQNPGTAQLYITLSRNNAKKIVWPELLRINAEFDLGGKPNESDLSLMMPNGSPIYCSGAADKSEIDKFRGLALKKCYLDESQSFRSHIQELIDDVISPALMDYAGTLCLIGTPGPIPAGFFHDCSTKGKSWSKHAWTFWDNPFIPIKSKTTHQKLLERELDRRGVTAEDPTIQREWFGKWAFDPESLLLRYEPEKNHFDLLPPRKWTYLMGIDLGYNDADALAVLAWCEQEPATYLVEEIVAAKQGLTELVGQIERLRGTYDISKMVVDEGGLGKKLAEELRRRHRVPLQPAEKSRKMENIALLNDALRTGRFKAKKTSRFAQDSYLLEKDLDKTTPEKIKVKDSFHSDIIDAVLYAFKESPAYTYEVPVKKPKYGTEEWARSEVTDMEQKAQEHFEALEKSEEGFGEKWGW
jgi:hypothetical protein